MLIRLFEKADDVSCKESAPRKTMANWDVEVLSMILLDLCPEFFRSLIDVQKTGCNVVAEADRRVPIAKQAYLSLITQELSWVWNGYQFLIFLGHRSR